LHIDDVALLQFIKSKLKVGIVNTYRNTALYKVIRIKDIQVIIDIFESNPLNTIKYLNFLDFKKAYELYTTSDEKSIELINLIDNIKGGMNKLRINFKRNNDFKITPYWLLGFVEAEGSFFVSKGKDFQYKLGFNLTQSIVDLPLMETIKKFLLDLPKNKKFEDTTINLNVGQIRSKSKQAVLISSYNTIYFRDVLIPFFDSMIWQSKKEFDYKDWKIILNLKDLGQNYTELGREVIELIINQMNLKRLSTKPIHNSKAIKGITTFENKQALQAKIAELLSLPSNLERKEDGRLLIISENRYLNEGAKQIQLLSRDPINPGEILKTFNSRVECAKFLNISSTTVANWLVKDDYKFIYKGKLVSLKIVTNS